MTDSATIQCERCGFTNARGDQFCGSCGAFLAWQEDAGTPATGPAEPSAGPVSGSSAPGVVAPGAPASPPPGIPSVPTTGPSPSTPPGTPAPPGGPVTAPVSPAPAAEPVPGPAEPVPDSDADLVRCPACGTANPASRTFCQSCGTTLAAAARVAEPSRDEIAAAVARTSVPTAAVAPGPVKAGADDQPSSGGGIPRWLFVVALAGVLVGVAAVLVGPFLMGSGPGSGATSAPTAGASAGPSGATASGSVPGGSGTASAAPPAVVRLTLTGAEASSYLGNKARYQPSNAIDGDLSTSWQEGSATEKGQWIEVSFAPSRADTLVIRNGYQASTALFKGNLRLKAVEVSVNGGPGTKVRLKDTTKAQRIDLGQASGATTVRITILSTYASVKTSVTGTPFQDAAVSEISVLGVSGG